MLSFSTTIWRLLTSCSYRDWCSMYTENASCPVSNAIPFRIFIRIFCSQRLCPIFVVSFCAVRFSICRANYFFREPFSDAFFCFRNDPKSLHRERAMNSRDSDYSPDLVTSVQTKIVKSIRGQWRSGSWVKLHIGMRNYENNPVTHKWNTCCRTLMWSYLCNTRTGQTIFA